jgi:DNA-binding FadR family transcriptional regulator
MPDLPNLLVFAPVAAPSTYEHTVERLGTAIRIGILPPGSRLPPERELAEQLGISRSTLRQALATLTTSGHLHAVRGRSGGTFVAETPPVASTTPFPVERTRAVLDWRMTLELGTVQLAAQRATDAQREALLATAPDFPELGEDWASFRRADAAFHIALAAAADSDRMLAAMTRMQGELSDLLASVAPTGTTREVCIEQHCAVAKAIAVGDAASARDAMREHLETTEQLLGRRINGNSAQDVG